jgi:hypothetical protein
MEAQELHRGRLIDHIQLVVHDLSASESFYAAFLLDPDGTISKPFTMVKRLGALLPCASRSNHSLKLCKRPGAATRITTLRTTLASSAVVIKSLLAPGDQASPLVFAVALTLLRKMEYFP